MRERELHDFVPAPVRPLTRALGRGFRVAEVLAHNAVARVHPAPLFVLGNQKSGTSAIAALLAKACGLSVTIDLRREIDRPTHDRVVAGERDFERYVRDNRWDFSREVVKEPNLTHLVPQLRERFPRSRMALVIRDPRDNIRSILDRLRLPGDAPRIDDGDWARISPAWRLVLDGAWCGLRADHYVDALAARWNRFADVHAEFADDIVLCRYEDFLRDKVGAIAALAEALGLQVVRDVSSDVDRQYQSAGDRSVAWSDFFGANLARIEAACGARMERYGYAVGDAAADDCSAGTNASS